MIRITMMAMIIRKKSRSWGKSAIVAAPREVMMIRVTLMMIMTFHMYMMIKMITMTVMIKTIVATAMISTRSWAICP